MSVVYVHNGQSDLIFTGGHDGTLIAWTLETGYSKFFLHENDPTCTSPNHIKDRKSVD